MWTTLVMFLKFYFEIIIDLQEIAKIVQRGLFTFTPFLPMVKPGITIIIPPHQGVDIGLLYNSGPFDPRVDPCNHPWSVEPRLPSPRPHAMCSTAYIETHIRQCYAFSFDFQTRRNSRE